MNGKEGVRAECQVGGGEVTGYEVASEMAMVIPGAADILKMSLTGPMLMNLILGTQKQVPACQSSGKH